MKNEMPALKPGMIVILNDESILFLLGIKSFDNYSKSEINKIYSPKEKTLFRFIDTPSSFWYKDVVNAINSSYDLVWERKPTVDWSKVPDNTKVLCRDKESEPWKKYHFAYYENGVVFVWVAGMTSFSAESDHDFAPYKYVVLYEGNEHLAGTNKSE